MDTENITSMYERLSQQHLEFMDALEEANEHLRGCALRSLRNASEKHRNSRVYRHLARHATDLSEGLSREETEMLLNWATATKPISMASMSEEAFTLVNLLSRGLVYLVIDTTDLGLFVYAAPMPEDLLEAEDGAEPLTP